MAERTIVVDGSTNAFRIAANEWGDATLFIAILERNWLMSPFFTQAQQIILPDKPTNVGGLPNQNLTKGSYQAPNPLDYPFTQTTTLAANGINTLQYTKGNIISWTTGKGKPA